VTSHPERWRPPFTQVELRQMWAYSDGVRTVRAFWRPGRWELVDQATGNVEGTLAAGEFAGRFRPVDVFADVTGFPTYLGTVAAADGTALVDLVLDRNPFMLANGPGRAARPHALMVPRAHRDGWSSATAAELAACHTAMTLVAAWYRTLDDGHVVFCANDSTPNLDYQRDAGETAAGTSVSTVAGARAGPAVTRNPRQEVQHAHLHAFYAESGETENQESSALAGQTVMAEGYHAYRAVLSGDAVRVEGGSTTLAAGIRAAAEPWGGSYCSYQLGLDGPFWVMPALGTAQDEFNRRLAQADGLQAEPDTRLGGAVNLVRPGLDDEGRRQAAEQATAELRAGFEAFLAGRGLNARALAGGLGLTEAEAASSRFVQVFQVEAVRPVALVVLGREVVRA
jgi:diadenosine tetraphosphate (Ap4A) HIT family hydrolase